MALSQEEISIRLGVNSQGVTKGMVQMNNFIARSLGDVQKKFLKFSTGLAAGFVVGAISDSVQFIIQKWSDGWDFAFKEMTNAWYGFTEDAMRDADRVSSRWKGIRDAQKKSWSQQDKTGEVARETQFDAAEESKKIDILEAEKFFADEKYKAALKELKIKQQLVTVGEELFKAEENYYAAVAERLKAQAALDNQVVKPFEGKGISPDQWTPRMGEKQFSYAQPRFEDAKTGTAAVDDYMSKIKAGQDAYKKKTDYSQFGKAIAEAQKEIAKVTVIPVRIVEIKE